MPNSQGPLLNERVAHLEATVENLGEKLDKATAKIDEMYAVMMQAKGAKATILLVGCFLGALASAILNKMPLNLFGK